MYPCTHITSNMRRGIHISLYIDAYRPACGLSTVCPLAFFLRLPALLLSYSEIRLLFRHSQILFFDLQHFVRCLTAVCHVSRDWPDLSILLQLSLKRSFDSFGLPTGREPDASSPYRSCFFGLLSTTRQTWPSQRSRLPTVLVLLHGL